MATETSELQHLQPLINAASAASELVSSAATKSYSAAKTYAPELTERIEKQSAPFIESAAPYLAPLATRAVDVGVASIKAADVKVGEVLASEKVKSFNASLAAWFESAKVVADAAIDKVKSPKLIEGVAAAREALSAAFLKAREASDPDVAFKLASDAWISFASYPAIAKVLSTASPLTTAGLSAFTKVHDTLVAHPTYKTIIERATATINPYASYAASTQAFQSYVKPVTDKVAASKVANSFVSYWAPAPQVAC